jgi:hypothetical protein
VGIEFFIAYNHTNPIAVIQDGSESLYIKVPILHLFIVLTLTKPREWLLFPTMNAKDIVG